jgi:hypothetical protein
LVPLITQNLFERIMAAAEMALWGGDGAADWHRQYEYFMSPDGRRYFDELDTAIAHEGERYNKPKGVTGPET